MSESKRMAFTPIRTSIPLDVPVPKGWKWIDLPEVARLESGHTPSRRVPEYWDKGDVPWLSLKDIRNLSGRYVTDTADKPTMLGIDNSSARVLPKGTVALCRTASVGKVVILGRDMATSQDFVDWVCGPQILPEYLFEAFRASGDAFRKEKQGTTHHTIYMPTVKRFKVLLPPLSEQKRIADILDKADAIRRKREEAISLLDMVAPALYQDRFGDPVHNRKGWDVVPFGKLFAVPPNYGTMIKPNETAVGWLDLRVANIQGGKLDLRDKKYVVLPDAMIERHEVREGDLLLARAIGSIEHLGKCIIAHPGSEKWAFDSHLMRVRFKTDRVLPRFVHAFLTTPGGRHEFLRNSRRSAVQFNINTKEMAKIGIPLPPIREQEKYIDELDRINTLSLHQNAVTKESDKLFNSLVQRSFTGHL